MAAGTLAGAARRLRSHLSGAGEWWWAPLVYAVAVGWIYRGLWHQHGHPTGLGWDVLQSYGPDQEFQVQDLRDGALSGWNPYDRGGYPVVADPGFARYYPVGWPFVAVGAVTGATWWWLIQLYMLAHHALAGSMMHLYLRNRGLSRSSAVVGGVTVVASVPLLIHKASLVFLPVVWVPLAWLALDRLCEAPSWRRGLAVAGAMALIVTAGSPPGLFYAVLLVGPYAVWRVVEHARARRGELRAYARRLALPIGLAAVATALVAAIVLVPFRELLPLTVRSGQKGAAFALTGPLPPGPTLAGMIAPSHGRVDAYIGMVALVLALVSVVLAWRREGRIALLWLGLGIAGLALSFGALWPVLPWLVDHVPGFARLRAPTRYNLLEVWALAALAGLGWSTITAELSRRGRWIATAIAVALVAATVLAIATRDPLTVPPIGRSALASIGFVAIAAALVAAVVWLPRWVPRRWPGCVLCVVVPVVIACDAPFFAFTPGAPVPAHPRPVTDREPAVLAELGDVARSWRFYDEFMLGDRVGVRRRVREFRGYPAGDPLSQWRYSDILARARAAPRILEAYNVRWILSGSAAGGAIVKHPDVDGHFVSRGPHRWEALHPAPEVAWYGAIHVVPTAEALDAVLAAEAADGARRLAVVEPDDATGLGAARAPLEAAAAAPPDSRTGEVADYATDELSVRIDAPAAGLVVVNEVTYPGWTVEVDGEAATPVRANYLLRAVAVGPGPHRIQWTFAPTHHRLLVLGYLAALAGILAAWPPWRRVAARVRRYARR